VLTLLTNGKQHKSIAHNLGISHRTVEVHRARIMKRCGARSFPELIRIAVRSGLHAE
jgi:two-component system response regulator FixJ